MINTVEQVLKAEQQPFVVDKELFLRYAKGDLAEVANKFAKNIVILDGSQMDELKKAVHISNVRQKCGKLGGRPKLPELTQEEIDKLEPKERERYKMRIWKRNSRLRKKNEENGV